MYQEINQQMEEAQQQIFRRKKLGAILEELQRQRSELEHKLEECLTVLKKEQGDVDKLEHQSLSHLFYSVLGRLGEQVEKEQREALAAKLKYDQAVSERTEVDARIRELEEEFVQYKDCQRVYDSLYEKKKAHMVDSHSQTGEQILMLTEQAKAVAFNQKEITEAIRAGEAVCSHIDSALNSLESAEGWGTWDLLGGGLVSDLMKHSHIDDAKEKADMIQRKLSQFRTELADVRIQNDIHFETNGFGKFADFFFDGLIADWCMQSHIADSKESIQNVRRQVEAVLVKLNSMKNLEDNHNKELQRRINELIIKA